MVTSRGRQMASTGVVARTKSWTDVETLPSGFRSTIMKRVHLLVAVCVLLSSVVLDAQRGGRGRAGGPALSPRQAAPIDLTGYWVSPIIEDWKYRWSRSQGRLRAVR